MARGTPLWLPASLLAPSLLGSRRKLPHPPARAPPARPLKSEVSSPGPGAHRLHMNRYCSPSELTLDPIALLLEATIFLEQPPLPVFEAAQPAHLTLVPFAGGVRIDALDGSYVQYMERTERDESRR